MERGSRRTFLGEIKVPTELARNVPVLCEQFDGCSDTDLVGVKALEGSTDDEAIACEASQAGEFEQIGDGPDGHGA